MTANAPQGQEHIPLLTPRPTGDVPVPVLTSPSSRLWHTEDAWSLCRRTLGPAPQETTVPVRELLGPWSCSRCTAALHPDELLAALDSPDRRVSLVGFATGFRFGTLMAPASRTARGLLDALVAAGVHHEVAGSHTVVAWPRPLARWLRQATMVSEMHTIRTVDASLTPLIATLWRDGPLHATLQAATSTARRLDRL